MNRRLSIIVAVARNGVIGRDNRLPWHIPEDFAWFKRHTEGRPVIMGRKTYESIGRPLPDRKNIILTRQKDYKVEGALVFNSLDRALETLHEDDFDEIFIIGGDQVFREAMDTVDRIYLTSIHRDYDGDTYMPTLPEEQFTKIFEEYHGGEVPFSFLIYERTEEDGNG
jgi:dihydrofolate reductase